MAKRGPKTQPDAVKVARGETRPSRRPDPPDNEVRFPKVKDPQELPTYIDTADGIEMWNELEPELRRLGILTQDNLRPLGLLCATWGLYTQQLRAGLKPPASDFAQLRLMFAEFGMTPASRGGIPRNSARPANRFAQLAGKR